jgi:hypothetical protein
MKIVTSLEYGKGINGEQYETVHNYEYDEKDIEEMKAQTKGETK